MVSNKTLHIVMLPETNSDKSPSNIPYGYDGNDILTMEMYDF
mgnify:CR=1 FL=1